MRPLHADRLHEGGNVIGEQFRRIGGLRLVALAGAARIHGNTGKALGVIGDLEGIAGIVGGQIGDEKERLTAALLLVIDSDTVGLDFRHVYKPPGYILAAVMSGDPAANVKSIYLSRRSPTTC